MEFAVALAAKGKFTAKPNPVVGCVIVNNNEIMKQKNFSKDFSYNNLDNKFDLKLANFFFNI